jgi:Carboxypeptidase regulatory-like domain
VRLMHSKPVQLQIPPPAMPLVAAPKTRRTSWTSLFLALAFVVTISASAMADTVSGRIYDPDGKPLPNATLTAKPAKGDAVEFKTNASGGFSTYLDPGRYAVTLSGNAGLQGVVDSYPQPVQQDIHLKKEGK